MLLLLLSPISMDFETPDWVKRIKIKESPQETIGQTCVDLLPNVQTVLRGRECDPKSVDSLEPDSLHVSVDEQGGDQNLGLVVSAANSGRRLVWHLFVLPRLEQFDLHKEIDEPASLELLSQFSSERRLALARALAKQFCELWTRMAQVDDVDELVEQRLDRMQTKAKTELRKACERVAGVTS